MESNNTFSFETNYGLKSINLVLSDITKLKIPINVLIVSAFKGNYHPIKGTIIGSLLDDGINVENLANTPEYDLRNSKGVWLSQKTDNEHIQRIACTEILYYNGQKDTDTPDINLKKQISSIFSLLAACVYDGIKIETIAMSVLGTGAQKFSPNVVIPILIEECKKAMETINGINTIYICTNTKNVLNELSTAMNHYLGRTPMELASIKFDEYTQPMLDPIIKDLKMIVSRRLSKKNPKPTKNILVISEFIDILENSDKHRGFELTILARRVLEVMVFDLTDDSSEENSNRISDLNGNLDKIAKKYKMAKWIKSYLHLIRILGNSTAHVGKSEEIPESPDSHDLIVLIHCLAIIIPYWKQLVLK